MRRLIFSLFFITHVYGIANAATITCSTTIPDDGCEAGCYESAGICIKCDNGYYSTGDAKQCDKCEIPNGATATDAGTSKNSCPWKASCSAGSYWDTTANSCETCPDNSITPSATTITFSGSGTPTVSGYITCENCGSYATANENQTECNGKAYKITLEKNQLKWGDLDKTVWVIYGEGFADNEKGENLREHPDIRPTMWWGAEFMGYYTQKTGGLIRFNNEGKLTNGTTNKTFTSDTTLYGHWNYDEYTVYYYKDESMTTQLSTQQCDTGSDCIAQTTKNENGKIFSHWKCGNENCTSSEIKPKDIIEPKENADSLTKEGIKLIAVYTTCPTGYYCNQTEGQQACPSGTTTNGEGKSTITDCEFLRGKDGTQFCDSMGCFTLPGSGFIKPN